MGLRLEVCAESNSGARIRSARAQVATRRGRHVGIHHAHCVEPSDGRTRRPPPSSDPADRPRAVHILMSSFARTSTRKSTTDNAIDTAVAAAAPTIP